MGWEVCAPFVEMVDPVRDGAADYFLVITEPMALRRIKEKLESKEYASLNDIKYDVNLIWNNSSIYNGPQAFYTLMAHEAVQWFNKKVKHLPETPEEEWVYRLNRVSRKFYDALCHPPTDLDPNNKLTVHDQEPVVKPVMSKGLGKGGKGMGKGGKTITFSS